MKQIILTIMRIVFFTSTLVLLNSMPVLAETQPAQPASDMPASLPTHQELVPNNEPINNKPNHNSIESTNATGETQTTVIDQNGNLKIMDKPKTTESPMKESTVPAAPLSTQTPAVAPSTPAPTPTPRSETNLTQPAPIPGSETHLTPSPGK